MMNDGSDSDNYYLLIYQLCWRWSIIMTGGAGDFHDQFSLYVSQHKLGKFLTLTHDQKTFDTWQIDYDTGTNVLLLIVRLTHL